MFLGTPSQTAALELMSQCELIAPVAKEKLHVPEDNLRQSCLSAWAHSWCKYFILVLFLSLLLSVFFILLWRLD